MPDATQADRRRRLGLCVSCGQADRAVGRSKCQACLDAARDAAAKRRADAADKGLCDACMVEPREEGRGGRCAYCADRYTARRRKGKVA